ncbi:MAG: YiiX/YebB-like N1pC/P60 family cysteine hydrolase [Arachidicoccus sp.]|nr:YiiX/YebB-like N1pC/P60 family cysteine hydrolase [Arachidicoccus sp.]
MFASCTPKYGVHLHNGDLLFVAANNQNLSGAIDRVTQTNHKTHYDHIALLEKKRNKYFVLQSNIPRGSEKISLDKFLKEENKRIDVYRLQKSFRSIIPSAIIRAENMIGKPYNYTYVLSDTAYYCSDFIQKSFSDDSIFALKPMTFKNADGKTDSAWINLYKKMNMDVPEGKPGCNPNGMAASPAIYFTGTLTAK